MLRSQLRIFKRLQSTTTRTIIEPVSTLQAPSTTTTPDLTTPATDLASSATDLTSTAAEIVSNTSNMIPPTFGLLNPAQFYLYITSQFLYLPPSICTLTLGMVFPFALQLPFSLYTKECQSIQLLQQHSDLVFKMREYMRQYENQEKMNTSQLQDAYKVQQEFKKLGLDKALTSAARDSGVQMSFFAAGVIGCESFMKHFPNDFVSSVDEHYLVALPCLALYYKFGEKLNQLFYISPIPKTISKFILGSLMTGMTLFYPFYNGTVLFMSTFALTHLMKDKIMQTSWLKKKFQHPTEKIFRLPFAYGAPIETPFWKHFQTARLLLKNKK